MEKEAHVAPLVANRVAGDALDASFHRVSALAEGRALETLRRVEEIPEANKRVVAQALLERGKIFDAQGRRARALAEYQKVLNLAADLDSIRHARAYRRQAYQPQPER